MSHLSPTLPAPKARLAAAGGHTSCSEGAGVVPVPANREAAHARLTARAPAKRVRTRAAPASSTSISQSGSAVQLPSIHAEIPLQLNPRGRQRIAAELTHLLVEAGIVHRRDLAAGNAKPMAVASRALNRWLSQTMGDELRVLSCQFSLEVHDKGDTLDCLTVEWRAGWEGDMHLGPPIEALEAQRQGLGATVLDLLDTQNAHPFYTPVDAFQQAIRCDWMGEKDEHLVLEECGDDEMERKAVLEQIVTREEFDEVLPAWVLTPLATRSLVPSLLAQVATGDDWCGRVAGATVRAQEALLLRGEAMHEVRDLLHVDEDSEFVGWAAIFSWDASDRVTERQAHDHEQYAMQDTCHDYVGACAIGPGDAQAVRRLLRAMRVHCRAVRALDALLALLQDGQ